MSSLMNRTQTSYLSHHYCVFGATFLEVRVRYKGKPSFLTKILVLQANCKISRENDVSDRDRIV